MSKNQSFLSRLRFALNGLAFSVRTERSIRVHVLALVGVVVVLAVFAPSPEWWALVALACGAVITTELINTAVEHLADHLHPEKHPSIGIVKDCSAAAVLVSSIAAIVVAGALALHLWRVHAAPHFSRCPSECRDTSEAAQSRASEERR
jgi:undecaprenol kinase